VDFKAQSIFSSFQPQLVSDKAPTENQERNRYGDQNQNQFCRFGPIIGITISSVRHGRLHPRSSSARHVSAESEARSRELKEAIEKSHRVIPMSRN
jgi:hypothetical protein